MERKLLVRVCFFVLFLLLSTLYLLSSMNPLGRSALQSNRYTNSTSDISHPGASRDVEEQERTFDNVRRFTRRVRSFEPSVLLLVLTKDAESWGSNLDRSPRTFGDFVGLLKSTELDFGTVSLGLLTSDASQYTLFKDGTRDLGFGSTTLFLHPGYADEDTSRNDRHDDASQGTRRGQIAKLRNYLMLRSLQDESHIIWLDADIYELHSPQIIQKMLTHAQSPNVGMITARCEVGPIDDYDGNAWSGSKSRQALAHAPDSACSDGDQGKETQRVASLIRGTSDDDLVPLDSVGATLLYMRGSLVHRGLTFPDSFTIGATWENTGWDGVESEGLCHRAKGLAGGTCWTLGGKWYTRHTDR